MTTPKNSDIHEALRRKYNDPPKIPADFLQRVHLADEKQKEVEKRRRWMRMSAIGLSVAAILVVAFILMKPETEVAEPASKHVTAHVQNRSVGTKDVAAGTETIEAVDMPAQSPISVRQKKNMNYHKAAKQSVVAVAKQADGDELFAETSQDETEKTTNMAEFVKTEKREPSISPEREAQLMAQLEEMKSEIYAYMDEVSARANEYQLQIDEVLDEANQQALELEYKLFELLHDELNLLYINGD